MGEIRGVVKEELEQRFRALAMKKFGYGKGSISKALEEAMHCWVESNQIAVKAETKAYEP
ncbi:MAG: hypothetical protein ACUVUE_07880 [Candidatus Bathycorpusculaceae bacterium]